MKVTSDSLVPSQLLINNKKRQQADYYEQVMRKHPGITYFLSRHALLFAGLLESQPEVISYTPYPFRFRIGKLVIKPDFYVAKRTADNIVFFHPETEPKPDWHELMVSFCKQHDWQLTYESPEQIYNREIEAENWLEIVRRLTFLDTQCLSDSTKDRLLYRATTEVCFTVSDIVDRTDRLSTLSDETALFALLASGELTGNLSDAPLSYSTKIERC